VPIQSSVGQGGANRPADVRRVQELLNASRRRRGLPSINVDGLIGPKTIAAITEFQQRETNIVDGRVDPNGPAIRALEAGASASNVEAAAAILAILQQLDFAVSSVGGNLPSNTLQDIASIRAQAKAIAPSVFDPGTFPFKGEFATGVQESRRQLGIVPAAAAAAGLTAAEIALILAILALAAVAIISALDPELGGKLKNAAIDAGATAVLNSIIDLQNIRLQVERCRSLERNPSPKCLQALAEFEQKIIEIVATRDELQAVLRELAGRVTTLFDKARLARVVQLTLKMGTQRKELLAIVDRIRIDCGCIFV